jgi:lysophospholipase L1-like esterase
MKLLGTVLVCLVLSGCTPIDVNHDGIRRVACIGDSNTAIGWDGHLAVQQPMRWCEYAATNCPTVQGQPTNWVNLAVAGSTAAVDGPVQIAQAKAAGADLAIIALGTNDIAFHGATPNSLVASLSTLCHTAFNNAPYLECVVATIPPIDDVIDVAPYNQAIIAAAAAAGVTVIDFTTGDTFNLPDFLHLDDAAEQTNASRVVASVCELP